MYFPNSVLSWTASPLRHVYRSQQPHCSSCRSDLLCGIMAFSVPRTQPTLNLDLPSCVALCNPNPLCLLKLLTATISPVVLDCWAHFWEVCGLVRSSAKRHLQQLFRGWKPLKPTLWVLPVPLCCTPLTSAFSRMCSDKNLNQIVQ